MVRCAVYTRKSSEEGLDQEFNSLDAQREACEAYILSQKQEGWLALPQAYDDGGVSGGTMDRPALKRLLADIEAGKIDAVVVYKVDRLTRSLSDFAKIVDVFDRHHVSFVSITQSFNTTTSMGRLTLNMLLSFAQFEREVTGERIRDKIAASKRKGLWMGGLPPLGYDVQDRKLVVNESEADIVRAIYRRYAELGSVRLLQQELEGVVVSKRRLDRFGRESGGKAFARGALYHLLQNRIYRGEIVHKGASYPGAHEAIVAEALWESVESLLASRRVGGDRGARAGQPSLLTGLAHDDAGERLTPTHANKNGTRYRYYVSRSLITPGRAGAHRGQRIPAGDLERLVEDRLMALLRDRAEIIRCLEPFLPGVSQRDAVAERAALLAGRWSGLTPHSKRAMLRTLVARVDVRYETVDIAVRARAIPVVIDPAFDWARSASEDSDSATIVLSVSARLKRAGIEAKLLIEGHTARREPDRSMLRILARAQQFQAMIMRGDDKTVADLAKEAGVSPSYFTRVLRLSFLAPEIVKAIIYDRHPLELTAKQLSLQVRLPNAWTDQAELLETA
jgi:DNA invertase Pin-like site-specific DNA recombinase